MDANLDHELVSAEARGAEQVRDQLRQVLDVSRRIVRLGDQQIEVVEVAALTEMLAED
jgi:hypothetical protein